MIPGPNRNVSSTTNSSGRWNTEPGRDRPYAARTVTPRLNAVPIAVMTRLMNNARVTTPPDSSCTYAATVNSRGTTTSPPARVTASVEDRLVTTTTYSGNAIASAISVSTTGLPSRPTTVGSSSQTALVVMISNTPPARPPGVRIGWLPGRGPGRRLP